MFSMEEDAQFVQDREDLISILRMRFGDVSPKVIEEIYKLDEIDTLDRLILVAANAPSYGVFLEEMEAGDGSFRIVGERFNPVGSMNREDD
ncbi:hypothetical protein ACLIBG_05645 [Virgibacillus sp. W0181]|uniref:hypothetical protein n=1 Tax=Virgibacillus sp. W0181 TaxID=3391581 RepID=UPI003F471BC7